MSETWVLSVVYSVVKMLLIKPLIILLLIWTRVVDATVPNGAVSIGPLSTLAHQVSGNVYALDSKRLFIDNFVYVGPAPKVTFWVGTGSLFSGQRAPSADACNVDDPGFTIRSYSGESVIVELPGNLVLSDIDYVSVWCELVGVDFGSITITSGIHSQIDSLPASLNADLVCVDGGPPMNCEPLSSEIEVKWVVNDSDQTVNFKLRGVASSGQYLGFGISGRTNEPWMIGADLNIARVDDTGAAFADDYIVTTRSQCGMTGGTFSGVCPDTVGGGTNENTDVSGSYVDGILEVSWTRPITLGSADDQSLTPTVEQQFIWSRGDFDGFAKKHKGGSNGGLGLTLSRPMENNCQTTLTPPAPSTPALPWFRPPIFNTERFTAVIGNSGGFRGAQAILGGSSWGIGWYLNDEIMPIVGVERGKTYTFEVFGGPTHPFYITSEVLGGLGSRGGNETVYAGGNETIGDLCEYTSPNPILADGNSFPNFFDSLDRTTLCPSSAAGYTFNWTVYYNCYTHTNLGWKIRVFDQGQVDEDELLALTGSSPETTNADCIANGIGYEQCATLELGFEIFYTLSPGTMLDIAVRLQHSGWIGFGFSNNDRMLESDVVVGWADGGSNSYCDDFHLSAYSSGGVNARRRQDLISCSVDSVDGYTTLRFMRELVVDSAVTILDDGEMYIVYSHGASGVFPAQQSGLLGTSESAPFSQHAERNVAKFNFASGLLSNDIKLSFLLHGILMTIAWGVLIPSGIMVARFMKVQGSTTWFKIHRGIQSFGLATAIGAYILAWVSFAPYTRMKHIILGSVIMFIGVMQPINALLRPHAPDFGGAPSKRRFAWEFIHKNLGRSTFFLFAGQMYLGLELLDGITLLGRILFWGTLVIVFLVFITLQLQKKITKKIESTSPRNDFFV